MCSRYSQTKSPAELAKRFKARQPKSNLQPRYNIAPTQEAPVLRLDAAGEREISLLRWGLLPSWTKEIAGAPLINARAETLGEKASFKQSLARRRCLVLSDGFYEWQKLGKDKLPWRFLRQDGEAFAMAGLWDVWQPAEGPAVESFTIVTTAANDLVSPVHDRMPVISPTRKRQMRGSRPLRPACSRPARHSSWTPTASALPSAISATTTRAFWRRSRPDSACGRFGSTGGPFLSCGFCRAQNRF